MRAFTYEFKKMFETVFNDTPGFIYKRNRIAPKRHMKNRRITGGVRVSPRCHLYIARYSVKWGRASGKDPQRLIHLCTAYSWLLAVVAAVVAIACIPATTSLHSFMIFRITVANRSLCVATMCTKC